MKDQVIKALDMVASNILKDVTLEEQKNILTYGCNVTMVYNDENGETVIKDITKEYIEPKGAKANN